MALSNAPIHTSNLELAFRRVVRGSNKEYKQFFRHLYPSYNQALATNAVDLARRLRDGSYEPSPPTLVYQPKKSGVLRPLTLLRLEDQIVYQAIVNVVADKFEREQRKLALKKRFGALYGGRASSFFFRSWKQGYRHYNRAITAAFNSGRHWVADFDLVSCYELIDHNLLRSCLKSKFKSHDILDLLLKCLSCWTTNASGSHLRHGLPQGPEASAFLAECLLFKFDALALKDVLYLRYVDDIRLMAAGDVPLRRALVKLDLMSKDTGLVPQAQKISLREAPTLDDILKTIPSSIASTALSSRPATQKELLAMFRKSTAKQKGTWQVVNQTHFRFASYRISPRLDLLARCGELLRSRPDLAHSLAAYFKKFPRNKYAADFLLAALQRDPTYDAAAAAYIDAMDVCEPVYKNTKYRRVIQTALRRSEEKTILVRIASLSFRAKRRGAADAIRLIQAEPNALVRSIVYSRLFCDEATAPFKLNQCLSALAAETRSADADVARFAASALIDYNAANSTIWKEPKGCHPSVKLLTVSLGIRSRGPRRQSLLQAYFDRQGVIVAMPWKKALKKDLAELERRCLRLQRLEISEPSAFVLMLDTFNEGLIHAFSRCHSGLAPAFAAAAAGDAHPDLGNWLRNGLFTTTLPTASVWFLQVHEARLRCELAHLKGKKGSTKGVVTKPLTFSSVGRLMKPAQRSWRELMSQWRALL